MKSIAVTLKGMEEIAKGEIKGQTKKITEGRILFETSNIKQLEKAKTLTKLYEYLKHFKFKKEEDIYEKAKKIKFPINKNFVVRCYREGKHNFKSKNVESKIGEIIFEKGYKVNLKNPKTTIYIEIINDTCIIGVLHKKDMQKRKYKIRMNSASINACIAAGMVRLAKVEKKHHIIDPFCKDGVIVIETALQGVKSVYGLDESLNNVKNSKVNAQVAKVKVSISKAEIDWLETKFEEGTIDRIITNPPFPSKNRKLSEIEKITKELMQQAKFVLKKDGLLVLITQNSKLIEKYAKEYGFKLTKELTIIIGGSIYKAQVFKP